MIKIKTDELFIYSFLVQQGIVIDPVCGNDIRGGNVNPATSDAG